MIFGKKTEKPEKLDSVTQKGLDDLEKGIESMKDLSLDEIQKRAPEIEETDPQLKWSKNQIADFDAPLIRPTRSYAPRSKPEPREAKKRAAGWELVKCIVENNEVIGEPVLFWLDKFKGDPTYYWEIPVNVPVYIPRFVGEHLATRSYHVFKMGEGAHLPDHSEVQKSMVIKETKNRLNCRLAGLGGL